MDDLEQRLRAAFADDRHALTPRGDSLSLIRVGVRRRRRNRTLAASLAVVVIAGGGALAASQLPGGTSPTHQLPPVERPTHTPTPAPKPSRPAPTTDEVPWLADPYNFRYPPEFPGAVADTGVPWCRASQLALTSSWQGAGGSWTGPLVVHNVSSSTCAVQGQPAVEMHAADGRVLAASIPEPFFVNAWVQLTPGQQAAATVVWSPEFCHQPAPATVVVDLPHGGGRMTTAIQGSPRCDSSALPASAGRLDVDGFVARPHNGPFTPLAGLQARLDRVPTTVYAGAVLHYRLELQADESGVALNPCLPFRERVVAQSTQHVAAEQDFRLNCDAAPATLGTAESNRTTYFDLRLALPGDIPLGNYALTWQSVLKPVSAVSDGVVRVVAPPPACTDGAVTATAGRSGAATGHYGMDIILRNISSSTCSLRGYPGVQLLDSSGHAMTPAPQKGSAFVFIDRGPQTVVLTPGATASFGIGGDDYDNVNQRPCSSSKSIAVIAPNTHQQLLVRVGFPACAGVTFSAVVPGSSGP